MPRVSFTQTFKQHGETDKFPEFKLRKGEKSRCWLPDEPWMEWYHRIEAPLIEDGEVVMEVKDTKRGPIEVQKMDWIGSAFCIGVTGTPDDPGPLMLEGIDPASCPACESAANSTGVKAPEQRFAAPIIKYKIRGRGQNPYELITPTTAEVLVWAYTGRIHGMLHDLAAREGTDLRKLDITVDLEDTAGADTFQKIKTLAAIGEPAWRDPKVRDYLRALWADQDNRPTDEQLRVACKGRDYARPVLADMVRRAERQWRDADRAGGSGGDLGAADAGFNGSLSEGIGSLLDSGPKDEDASARIAEMREETRREVTGIVSPDPFADESPAANGVTTTVTSAPDAVSPSGTERSPASSAPSTSDPWDSPLPDDQRAAAVEEAADEIFGPGNGDGPASPSPVPAAKPGNVVDFDDLFS